MEGGFRVLPFEEEAFLGLLCGISGASPRVVKGKNQYQYFFKYLVESGCKTLVGEYGYIDHDFLAFGQTFGRFFCFSF